MVILENIDIDIDIDKAILQNIDINKILNRFKFGISNRAIATHDRKSTDRKDWLPKETEDIGSDQNCDQESKIQDI